MSSEMLFKLAVASTFVGANVAGIHYLGATQFGHMVLCEMLDQVECEALKLFTFDFNLRKLDSTISIPVHISCRNPCPLLFVPSEGDRWSPGRGPSKDDARD
jgi:hypothetical protein